MSTCVVGVMRVLCVIFSFSFFPPIGFSFLIFHVNLLDNRGMGVWTNFSLHNPANGCRSTAQMALDMVLAYTFVFSAIGILVCLVQISAYLLLQLEWLLIALPFLMISWVHFCCKNSIGRTESKYFYVVFWFVMAGLVVFQFDN